MKKPDRTTSIHEPTITVHHKNPYDIVFEGVKPTKTNTLTVPVNKFELSKSLELEIEEFGKQGIGSLDGLEPTLLEPCSPPRLFGYDEP